MEYDDKPGIKNDRVATRWGAPRVWIIVAAVVILAVATKLLGFW